MDLLAILVADLQRRFETTVRCMGLLVNALLGAQTSSTLGVCEFAQLALTIVPSVALVSAPRTTPPCKENGLFKVSTTIEVLIAPVDVLTANVIPQMVVPVLCAFGNFDAGKPAVILAFLQNKATKQYVLKTLTKFWNILSEAVHT